MLTESQVIEAVCQYLRRKGWRIVSRCSESERGDDVVAEHKASGVVAVIEAKGETSSKRHTNRFGLAFNSRQVSSHVARAFFRAAQTVGSATRGAIALPRTDLHVDRVRKIEPALRKLRVEVFWVDARERVSTSGIWQGAR
jgi:Holliday junction resolvase-like predicted endonuclease